MITWWLACSSERGSPLEPSPALLPVEILARASLDLRGVRPTLAEIAQIEGDPAALDPLLESFLDDPRFGLRVQTLWGDVLLTRQDVWPVTAASLGLSDEASFAAAVGEEPLRIIRQIAEQDLPWTEVVVGDWTMVEDNLAAAWPVAASDGASWRSAVYTDGRPSAGILATNGLWWRYRSTDSNMNRGRANAISRSLLCNDYLDAQITFDRNLDLLDADAVADALQSNPACLACHATLDPLAAYLFGFYQYLDYSPLEMTLYHAERERMWADTVHTAPAFYGVSGNNLADLGRQIADDPRLVSCAVNRSFEMLHQRPMGLQDTEAFNEFYRAFVGADLHLDALFGAIVAHPSYRSTQPAVGGGYRMLSVDQLGTVLEDLTGYRLMIAGVDPVLSPSLGLRTLAGGTDGAAIDSATLPSATTLLVTERLASAAASYVVSEQPGRLFTEIDPSEHIDARPDAAIAQVQAFHLRLYSQHIDADGPEVQGTLALWRELYAIADDTEMAWTGVLVGLLRDPALLVY